MSFSDLITQEAFVSNCCSIKDGSGHTLENLNALSDCSDSETILHMDMSDWLNTLNADLLINASSRFQYVCLTIKEITSLSPASCQLIAEIIGPKLIELTIDNCNSLVWNEDVKKLLGKSRSIGTLRLKKNRWLNDNVLEQLSIRFHSTLVELDLEQSNEVTNNGLFQIGRRCSRLDKLSLSCCPQISDNGLLELTKKIHLSRIHLAHNLLITDYSVEALISVARAVSSVSLVNCPKLTDRAVASLFEAVVSWGKKRNVESAGLTSIELRDNSNFSSQSLVYLSASVPNVVSVDFRDCIGVNLVKGLGEMAAMQRIASLKVGPSNVKVDSFGLLDTLICHAETLRVLHLVGLRGFLDEQIAHLLELTLDLDELCLVDMSFGIHTVEALCSYVPNISRLTLVGSPILIDAELQCVASVCLHLMELTVQRCSKITDIGFIRCVNLRLLTSLNVSNCSPHCTAALIKCFTVCPLQSVVLDGLKLCRPKMLFTSLSRVTSSTMTNISMRGCTGISAEDVLFVLSNFIRCRSVDLTGTSMSTIAAIRGTKTAVAKGDRKLPPLSPFLSFEQVAEFSGFRLNPVGRARYTQYFSKIKQYRRHYAARLLQKLRRKYKLRLLELKELRRELWSDFKIERAVIIQSAMRRLLAKRKCLPKLLAGRKIVQAAKNYAVYSLYVRSRKAARHFRTHLKRSLIHLLLGWQHISTTALRASSEAVTRMTGRRLMARVFRTLCFMKVELVEKQFVDSALVVWEISFLKRILSHWRTVLYETSSRKQLLVRCFLNIVDTNTLNSSRQMARVNMAVHFRKRRLVLPAWLCFAHDLLEIRRINSLDPMARNHFQRTFFARVVGAGFRELVSYRATRHFKKSAQVRGDLGYVFYKTLTACRKFDLRSEYRRRERSAALRVMNVRLNFVLRTALKRRFQVFRRHSVHFKLQRAFSDQHVARRRFFKGYETFARSVVRMKAWRVMNRLAENKRDHRLTNMTFQAWCEFKKYNRNLGELYYKQYLARLTRRVFNGFVLNRAMGKDYYRMMAMETERRAGNEKAFKKAVFVLRKFQALYRGILQHRKFQETRVQKLFAIQTLQNFTCTVLARKEFASRLKKQLLVETVREDQELDLMREAEAETLFYNYFINAVETIQRTFRGWKGRGVAFLVAVDFYKERSKEYYLENEHLKLRHEAFQRAAIAREHLRHKAAIMIQKRVRGMRARVGFMALKWRAKMARYAVFVQREYRRRLAQLKLRRMKRDKISDIRFKAARKQRGMILRLFGLRDRQSQGAVKGLLDNLGLDPLSFNYRVGELVTETINDFRNLIGIYNRERDLIKENGLNRLAAAVERRRILGAQGWKLKVQDAVRIIEAGHRFEGHTGTICRIDETLLGIPLYEVKLDRFPRQTFVRMTADPLLNYVLSQPLSKIQKEPPLDEMVQSFVIFGLDPEDPLFSKRNVECAWTIQRAYRMHRSKQIAARKRYEFWMRCCATQWSLFNHMSETNTLSMQGYHVAQALRINSVKPVHYNEQRHFILPGRLTSNARKPHEQVVIGREFEVKFKDRMVYMQRSALITGKQFFSLGYQRMTFNRKLNLFVNVAVGLVSSGGTNIRDLFGSRGAKFLSKQKSMVTGLDKYCFKQFLGSPHVRYFKTSMFQGEWSGIPLFTPLRPHGEGIICFLDGWGFAREDKVLYLQILRCRYLNPMDLTSSDPYCDIFCNGINLQTSVKWKNLNPEYHESFEIDVTNPSATLNIQVKDKDFLGSDDFMGQIAVQLSEFVDGKEHFRKYLLKGEDVKEDEGGYDRGEIEIRVRWSERVFEDDQARLEDKRMKAIRLQAWARRVSALNTLKTFRREHAELMRMIRNRAIKITSTMRMRLARKELKKLYRHAKSATKIQKRVRIWIAKKVFRRKKLRSKKATIIQARMRVCLAKSLVKRMKEKIQGDLDATAAVIQKYARRKIVLNRVKALRKLKLRSIAAQQPAEGDDDSINGPSVEPKVVPVSVWILTYGRDAEYGLKRNRRITLRLFKKMLTMRFVRLVTQRYGLVYVDSYPPRKSEEEVLAEMQGAAGGAGEEPLTVRTDFVSVYFPAFRTLTTHRKEAVELCKKFEHLAIMHIPSSVELRKSVDYTVTVIQCAQRCRVARAAHAKMLRVLKAISLFQRIFRRRYELLHSASVVVTSLFRLILATKRVRKMSLERSSALKIQLSYRCYLARCDMFDRRCVTKLSVLKSSASMEFHGPEKALEHRSDTFWLASSNEKAELRVEMSKTETLTEIWLMTSTFSTSPQYVSISAVVHKKGGVYEELIEKQALPLLKEHRWHKFPIPVTASKYFLLTFLENYGDETCIGVRQVRFVRSKEKSVRIVKEPAHYVLDNGPMVGDAAEIVLRVEADGWPRPTYQWYNKNERISGAIHAELKLILRCNTYGHRTYRCVRCKMVSKEVPLNAYHVKCGNCAYLFAYKEAEEYDKEISKIRFKEEGLHKDKTSLLLSKIQMESFDNPKYKLLLADVTDQLLVIETTLQRLRESRINLKDSMDQVNRYSHEGIYTCHVQNIRGGSMKMKKNTVSAVVVVEHSKPYVVSVVPTYTARPQTIRKRWNVYGSLQGTFKKGRVEGLVVIRYYDNSYYEGPYVQEDALDAMGVVCSSMRAKNHYGVYRLADGRVFEGNNVDNHFDPNNLQAFYRLTMPDGEVYEGNFCDESFHGIGMYVYKDGSIYEGSWHRGTRFGHGHYRSAEGWSYEGFYDTNRRHREGVINWPDGSCYMGDWYYDKIQGRGIFITALRDVYRGELLDQHFHGQGEIIYGDGSRHVGHFANGLRNGRGVFTEKEGNEYYGHFVDDRYHGEHVVKLIIPIEERSQDNYEIRIAVYEHGEFVKWKSKFSNPLATKQFVSLFRDSRDMFDSVYSMMLAKNLPGLPDGIDATDAQVKQIVFRIRNEAGMLVGQHALNQAQAQLDALLKPMQLKAQEVDALKIDIENMSMTQLVLEKDSSQFFYKFTNMIAKYEKDTLKIEQYWTDDPTEVRATFLLACTKLNDITVEEFFAFRNHRVVPMYVKKVFDALSYLLGISTEWKVQQFIIADSIANSRNGDEEAVRFDYKCKLAHMMPTYKVYDHVQASTHDELAIIMADSRFRSDSYYIESTGKPGPILVDWIKSNYSYIRAAKNMYRILNAAEEKRLEAFRFRAVYAKKKEEVADLVGRLDLAKARLKALTLELEDLQHAVLKANDLLQFIAGRTDYGNAAAKQDYYKLLEQKMEQNRDKFVIEVCMQSIVDGVVANSEKEKVSKMREAMALNLVYVEQDMSRPQIVDWITTEVCEQQERILAGGKTLGYSFETEEPTAVTKQYSTQIISLVIDITVAKMNERLNDLADAKQWISMKGKILTSRFLYITAWKIWEREAIARRDRDAEESWESIFGARGECGKMAIEAKISVRMSSVAREQAKVWAKSHPLEIQAAEKDLAASFESKYPDDPARSALDLEEDLSEAITPGERAECMCWTRLHPQEMSAARDERNFYYAEEFAKQFPDQTGETAFRILNGWANADDMMWVEYAEFWKSFNMEKYLASSHVLVAEMGREFVEAYPLNTALEAARVIENSALCHFIRDGETRETYTPLPRHVLNANCWGMHNQGLLRKGRDALLTENMTSIGQQWNELLLQTDNFQKGSILLTQGDGAGEDRFAGFRNRLTTKFAWMHAYFCKQHKDLQQELTELILGDPIHKVFHNIRPSERDKVVRDIEDTFIKRRTQLETQCMQVVERISSWNTYFGVLHRPEDAMIDEK